MKRLTHLVVLLTVALGAAGCSGSSSKGVNKDQDRPKSAADTKR